MFYSAKLKLLVIGIPKTGTVTVENALMKIDPLGEKSSITVNNLVYTESHFKQGIVNHARAKEIKEGIGASIYESLHTIAFVRDPFAKLVSAYFFNSGNSLFGFKNIAGERLLFWRRFKYFVSISISKILPFYIWAFIYPYKSNYEYIFDDKGVCLVKYIGRTEHLQSDLLGILHRIGIDCSNLEIGHLNRSQHKNPQSYFRNSVFRYLISIKLRKDIALYRQIEHDLG